MKKLIGAIIIAILLLSIIVVSGCVRKPKEVKIGAILPLTGDAAAWGERAKEGIDMAVDELNKAGGIKGVPVEVIYEDSKAVPKEGVNAMKKLVTVDNVQVVIGDVVSSVTLAIAPIANENKVVVISPSASAPEVTDAGEYIFRNWPSDVYEGRVIAKFAYNDLNIENIAILYINNDYGASLKDVVAKTFEEQGGKVLVVDNYFEDATDFRTQLTKIKHKNPEAIYIISYYKDGALILQQAKEIGIQSRFLGASAIEDPKLLEIVGDAAEGLIYPVSSGYDPNSEEDIVQEFKKTFKDKYGEEPAYLNAQAYDATKIVALSIEKGGFSGEEIQKAMSQIKDYPGVTGKTTFDENGDVIKQMLIKTVKNGKFVLYESNK